MLRKLAVFLTCVVGIASASRLNHGHHGHHGHHGRHDIRTGETKSFVSHSTPAPALAVSSPQPYYNAPVAQTQQASLPPITHAYVASPNPSYTIDPAIVEPVALPAPVPANTVSYGAHQHGTAHSPSAKRPVSAVQQPVQYVNGPAVQYIQDPVGQPAVQVGSNIVQGFAIVGPTISPQLIQRPAVQYVYGPFTNGIQSEDVNTVPTTHGIVPVAANKVTIESHQSVTAHPSAAIYANPPVRVQQPVPLYLNRPAVRYASVPVNPTLQVTSYPPLSYVSSTGASLPAAQIQRVQYVPAPQPPVAPKTVTIESHKSVTAHPPKPVVPLVPVQNVVTTSPAVQYVPAPAYAAVPEIFSQNGASRGPISVPAIFNAPETQGQRFVAVANPQPAPEVVTYQRPVPKFIPVPVAYPRSGPYIKYNQQVDTPVVYTKSIVEKDHASADSVATHVVPTYTGYARANKYSPASSVSRVSFNGLGVNYSW